MIPETSQNKTVEVYEAVSFPDKWQLKQVLLENIEAADVNLFYHNNKCWMFANVAKPGISIMDELYIFYSNSPFGEWEPHVKNPVVSDCKTSRPAGRIFYLDGDIIRPSQETSLRYGYSLNFNKIEKLTENDYKEILIKKVRPGFIPKNLAIHTYNRGKNYEIIDGMKLI